MIPVDFIIRASSAAFTKAMAGAENSVRGLKKSLASFGGGNLGAAIGIAGIVKGFSTAITYAQDLRDELEGLSLPVDDATRSVAEYGDQVDNLKEVFGKALASGLSFFTRAGEGWAQLINRVRGYSLEEQWAFAEREKQAEQTLKRIKEARAEFLRDNSPEKIRAAEERLARVREEGAKRVAETEERIRLIAEKKKQLEMEIAGIADGRISKVEKQTELAQLEIDLIAEKKKREEEITEEKEKQAKTEEKIMELRKDQAKAREDVADVKKDQATARADTYLPSIEELADRARENRRQRESYGIGSSGSLVSALDEDSPEVRALKAVELEEKAKTLALDSSLDPKDRLEQASKFQAEAEELRGGLSGFAQSSDTNIGAEFKDALAESEKQLAEINEKLAGKYKAE